MAVLARGAAARSAWRAARSREWLESTYARHLYGGWEREDGRWIDEPHLLGMKFHEACKALWCPVCLLCNKGTRDCRCRPPQACWAYLGQIGKDWTDTFPCPAHPEHGAIPARHALYKSVFGLAGNQSGKTTAMLSETCAWSIGRRPWDDTLTMFPGQNRLWLIGCMSLSKSAITVICPEIETRIGHMIDKQLTSAGGAVSGYRLKPPWLDTYTIASQEQVRNAGRDGVNPGEGGRFDACAWDEPPDPRFRKPVLRGLVRARSKGGGYGREIGAMTPMNSHYVLEEVQRKAWNMGGDEPSMHVVNGTIHDNPSLTEEGKRQIMSGWDSVEREAREFGAFLHLAGRIFPEFCHAHEYDEAEFDPLWKTEEDGTKVPSDNPVMLVVDPHGRRRWVMVWVCIDPEDNAWVVREWPEDPKLVNAAIRYGEDGVFDWMAKEIKSVNESLPGGSERVIWYEMDPNFGLSPATGSGWDTVVAAMRAAGKKIGVRMPFRTDVSDDLDQGHAKLRHMLAWNDTEPLSITNQPALRVSQRCRGVRWAFHNYVYRLKDTEYVDKSEALKEKPSEVGKDHIDTLRYFAMRAPKWRSWRGRGASIANQIQRKAERLIESG